MRRGLNARLVAGSLALLVLIAGAFALTSASVGSLRDANEELERSLARVATAEEAEKLAIDIETGMRGFVITGDPAFLEPYASAVRLIPSIRRRLISGIPGDQAQAQAIARRTMSWIADYVHDYATPQVERARRDLAEARRIAGLGEGKRRVDAIRAAFDELGRLVAGHAADVRRESEDAARRAVLFGLIGLAGCPLLVLAFSGYLSRLVVAPIRRVAGAADRLALGDLTTRVEERGVAEAATLSSAFNAMAETLQHSRDELENQNAELEAQQGELERTLDALAEEQARAEAFHRVVARISAEAELEPLADVLLEELGAILGADAGTLYVLDPTDPDTPHVLAAARGFERARLPARLAPDAGLAGRAMAERRTLSAAPEASGLGLTAFGGEVPVRHELHVPFLNHDEPIAVASFARVGATPFPAAALEAVAQLAEPVAVGLARTVAYRSAQHQTEVVATVLDTAQDAYLAVDDAMVIEAWSSQAQALFGHAAEDAIGRRVPDLIVPERYRARYAAGHEALLAQAEREGSVTHRYELHACHADGREFRIELSIAPVRVGGRWRFNGFARDVTAQVRRARQREARGAVSRVLAEVKDTRSLAQPILAGLGESLRWPLAAYWAPDAEGTLACVELWRAPATEGTEALEGALRSARFAPGRGLVGRAWGEQRPCWTRTADDPVIAESTAGTGLRIAAAVPIGRGEQALGVLQFWQHEATPPDDELFETLDAIAGLVVQVTERRSAEARADRMKDEFFALVSHELRTPLTSIVGYLELVLEGDAGELTEEQGRFLGVVERNARRLQRLVGDLLFVAQVEAGTLSLERGVAQLDTIVQDAVDAARPRADQLQVAVTAETEPVPSIVGDRDRLGQLVDNLIVNALKFTPAGGAVRVALRPLRRDGDEDALELSVRDTGIGIPPEEQKRLFDRFYRASTAVEREIPGIGLGLSICQAIAEGHGGRIEVESEVGRGTTFRIVLPLRAPVEASRAAARSRA